MYSKMSIEVSSEQYSHFLQLKEKETQRAIARKKYYEKNKEKFAARAKVYREKNREQILQQKKGYYNRNKKKIYEVRGLKPCTLASSSS